MIQRKSISILAAAAVLCLASPAAAETFTSSDGVLSIELPDDTWKEVQDPASFIVLSDGANVITINHYSNGEKLPDISVADDHFVNVYEGVFSTQNEVFLVTGSVVDAQDISKICNSILSLKVLKYDTKLAVKDNTPSVSEFTIVPMDETMYVIADGGLKVRSGSSMSSQVIGGLADGSSVHVTGKVQQKGADIGWYQISYNSGSGFVSASFLSSKARNAGTQESAKTQTSSRTYTGSVKTVYASDGTAITIYEANDGSWYDSNGKKYNLVTDYEFSSESGGSYSVNRPQTGNSSIELISGPLTVFWGNSNQDTLSLYTDGYYYSSGWVRYTDNGNGTYSGADGTTLYSYDPVAASQANQASESDSDESFYLESEGSGRPVTVSPGGGAYYDDDGVEYHNQGDGSFIDENGDIFWIR